MFNRDPEIKIRGISLIFSLLFHALLIFLMLKIVPPVRLYLFQKVADVIIVSPETVSLPLWLGSPSKAGIRGEPSPEISPEAASQIKVEGSVRGELSHGEVILPNLSFGLDRDEMEDVSSPYADVPDFHLDPSSKEKTGFSLSLEVGKKETDRIGEEKELKDLNLSRLVSAGLSSLRFKRVEAGKNARRALISGPGNQQQSPSINFDFSPWAKEVVDKIRNNWIVPPIEESRARGEVKIFIVIGKDGTLIELEVLDSSGFSLFDESAVQAIRSSAPFIPLPEDFPEERLETYLVFEFND